MRKGLVWSLLFFIFVSVASLGATIISGHTPLLGLDLKGGVSVVEQPQGTVNNATLDEAVNIIENRVNALGVSNSDVARQGNDVVIDLPGIKDAQKALAEVGETATLYFRPVDCQIPIYVAPTKTSATTTVPRSATTTVPKSGTTLPAKVTPTTVKSPSTTAKAASAGTAGSYRLTSALLGASSASSTTVPAKKVTTTPTTTAPISASSALAEAACSSSNASTIPSTPIGQDQKNSSVILPDYTGTVRYVLGPADMTGSAVSDAQEEVNSSTGEYTVVLTFTSKGATEFDNIATSRYACYQQDTSNPPYCSEEAFELDGQVESAPTIQASSFQGTAVISGSSSNPFTSSQASRLAVELKYGSLPVRFVPQSVQTISASIGKDSLRAGLLAGLGGLIVVMIYMLIYYRGLGLVVLAGLGFGGSILYSLITELSQSKGLTLTLAGVTGIIVSIGITVDSYVVYFERLKDEVRAGRTVRQSVERSFSRAWRTVIAADSVSFLAALVLYFLTVGDVRGFAFTLGLSTLLDVGTAWFFIRPAVVLVGRRRAFTENRVFGISRGLGARSAREDV